MKLSVILPCRNEEKSIGSCINDVKKVLGKRRYEIIVSDSSTDASPSIARSLGAKVVTHEKGYGNAYLEGIEAATGDVIVMADSDSTYNLGEVPALINKLDEGYDFVLGSRFMGAMEDGAMPWLHRYVGNPLFNLLFRVLFGMKITDSHSGFRVITRDAAKKLSLESRGMEFASEMIIKAKRHGLRIAEVPASYRLRKGESKMRSFRDGWRHLRLMVSSVGK